MVSPKLNGNDDGETNDVSPYVLLVKSDILDCDYDCWHHSFDLGYKGMEKEKVND